MNDLKSLLKPAVRRSTSTTSPTTDISTSPSSLSVTDRSRTKNSLRPGKSKRASFALPVDGQRELHSLPSTQSAASHAPIPIRTSEQKTIRFPEAAPSPPVITPIDQVDNPRLVIEQATPENRGRSLPTEDTTKSPPPENPNRLRERDAQPSTERSLTLAARRHSPISLSQDRVFATPKHSHTEPHGRLPAAPSPNPPPPSAKMPKKIWVKMPKADATRVAISEDDLVDDVKDVVLRKYANSLGRHFDPPDFTLKVSLAPHSSRHTNERPLRPDENILKILEAHYPKGQSIDEALLIDVPQRRTPKHSPRIPVSSYYMTEDLRPGENGTDYFPPMPVNGPHSPHLPSNLAVQGGHPTIHRLPTHQNSISVIETGHVPNLPSPGALNRNRHADRQRPRYGRQHTSSPTVLNSGSHSQNHDVHKAPATQNVHLPTPPLAPADVPHRTATPPPRTSSPRPTQKPKRAKKSPNGTKSSNQGPLGDVAIPPINVLIVEDNHINLRLLEAFLKRLKVRWSTAINGEIAVNKWREGGFHLVLMDIQLPVMNGLDATKEIRRLERVNSIGINRGGNTPTFEKAANEAMMIDGGNDPSEGLVKKPKEEDNLVNTDLFKSPVIIVALTASSLQSDRHEALAAGCNDFLTKPVNFDWLSRKVMEWGCMQALIDFDGWRKWKDFTSAPAAAKDGKKQAALPPAKDATGANKSTTPKKGEKRDNGSPGGGVVQGGDAGGDAGAKKPKMTAVEEVITRDRGESGGSGATSSSGEGS